MKFNNDIQVESRLPIIPNPKYGNLEICSIESIVINEVEMPLILEDGKESTNEYKGLTVPRIVITFVTNPSDGSEPRYCTYNNGVIVSVKNDGSPQDKKVLGNLYTNLFKDLKHIHNAFAKCKGWADIKSYPEVDENAAPAKRAKQFAEFFQCFIDAIKPFIGIPVYIKVVADKDGKRFTTPTFVGQGWLEAVEIVNNIPSKPKRISILPTDRITLTPQAGKKSVGIKTGDEEEVSDEINNILKQFNS